MQWETSAPWQGEHSGNSQSWNWKEQLPTWQLLFLPGLITNKSLPQQAKQEHRVKIYTQSYSHQRNDKSKLQGWELQPTHFSSCGRRDFRESSASVVRRMSHLTDSVDSPMDVSIPRHEKNQKRVWYRQSSMLPKKCWPTTKGDIWHSVAKMRWLTSTAHWRQNLIQH